MTLQPQVQPFKKNEPIMKYCLKPITLLLCCMTLSACGTFFDKDNTPTPAPLVSIKEEIHPKPLWSTHTGGSIASHDYLKLVPAFQNNTLFTTDQAGQVTAVDATTGKVRWITRTGLNTTSGPGLGDTTVLIAGHDGDVMALDQTDGKRRWLSRVSSEILSPPTASNGIVLVKSIDGELTALSEAEGQLLWKYIQNEPTLFLRSGSAPKVAKNNVFVGFSNGNLAKLTLNQGNLLWKRTIAIPSGSFAIQRMVDIDADPSIVDHRIYVATYQGKIAALEIGSGQEIWSTDISSYTGLAANNHQVVVSDAQSHLYAFDALSGHTDWEQPQLESRNISGPALIDQYLVVGDGEGYLHWLNQQDGRIVARTKVGGAILAAPIVNDRTVYVLTRDGRLSAYALY